MTTFPYGYSGSPQGMGTMLTWDQMMTKSTVYNLHPEVRRRLKALIEFAASKGVHLGVGTGWRVQPNPPPSGFAQPGNSWHESCPVDPTSPTALAIDAVCDVSWNWMEDNCAAYGFRTFRNVNDEPWHIQPAEIPAGRSYATVLPPLKTWELPGDEDLPLTDEDIKRIAKAVWDEVISGDAPDEKKPARWRLKQIQGMCRNYLGGFDDSKPTPDRTLLQQVYTNTKK